MRRSVEWHDPFHMNIKTECWLNCPHSDHNLSLIFSYRNSLTFPTYWSTFIIWFDWFAIIPIIHNCQQSKCCISLDQYSHLSIKSKIITYSAQDIPPIRACSKCTNRIQCTNYICNLEALYIYSKLSSFYLRRHLPNTFNSTRHLAKASVYFLLADHFDLFQVTYFHTQHTKSSH